MILKHMHGISFFQFPKLAVFSSIWHGVFTRNNGTSKGSYSSLNVSFNVGDDHRSVRQNREIISKCLKGEELVFVNQVHSVRVLIFDRDNESGILDSVDGLSGQVFTEVKGRPADVFESESGRLLIGDASVTNIPRKNLVIKVADCQSVLLYEPVQQVVANIHAGWRGSINNIIGRTITIMEQNFGCDPPNIVAGISPSLGPCCAEFVNYRQEIPQVYWKYKDDRDHFDFWTVSRSQLCDAGVRDENIDIGRICTKCDTDIFFSYRGERTTGRFATVIGLK